MRLIDADAIKYIKTLDPLGDGRSEYIEIINKDQIDNMLSIDAVLATYGIWKWKIYENGYGTWECSACGCPMIARFNYCPNCGARMVGGEW